MAKKTMRAELVITPVFEVDGKRKTIKEFSEEIIPALKEATELDHSDIWQCAARYVVRTLEKEDAAPNELEAAVDLAKSLLY